MVLGNRYIHRRSCVYFFSSSECLISKVHCVHSMQMLSENTLEWSELMTGKYTNKAPGVLHPTQWGPWRWSVKGHRHTIPDERRKDNIYAHDSMMSCFSFRALRYAKMSEINTTAAIQKQHNAWIFVPQTEREPERDKGQPVRSWIDLRWAWHYPSGIYSTTAEDCEKRGSNWLLTGYLDFSYFVVGCNILH